MIGEGKIGPKKSHSCILKGLKGPIFGEEWEASRLLFSHDAE